MLELLALILAAEPAAGRPDAAPADIAWVAAGRFCEPETVLPLPDGTLLVSNVCGFRETGSGFLTLLDPHGRAIDWRVVDGLDSPLGMALHGDRLHVVDGNHVKSFRWPGFEPVATIALETGVANDIAVALDGTRYVTDSARGEVVVVTPDLERIVLTGEPTFPGANGIHVDGDSLWVGGARLWRVDLRDNSVTTIGPPWLSDIDGVEREADGTLQVSLVGGPLIRLAEEPEVIGRASVSSANHGYSAELGLALIPTGFDNTVLAVRVGTERNDETYRGYRWQGVADGVYLHFAIDPLAGPVDGNSVIVDIGDSVVVIDTHINPAVARTLVALIQEHIDKPVTRIVNTHWHDDHVNGNHAFTNAWPEATIIAHRATLGALRAEWQVMEEQRAAAYATVDVQQIRQAAEALDDPMQATGYRLYADYVEALRPELPTLQLLYPETVFEDRFVIGGATRRIELQWLGRGNTDGDIIAWLPEEKILVTGDLLVYPVPFAFNSPMAEWIATLDAIATFDASLIIPGHGPAQRDRTYLEQVRALFDATMEQVRRAHDAGVAYDELANAVDLATFEQQFTGDDEQRRFAWLTYFLSPGLKSAWTSLGYPIQEDDP